MLFRTGRFLIPALFLCWLALAGAAPASGEKAPADTPKSPATTHKVEYHKVKDEAGFFKPETLDKVNALVKEIKEKYHVDYCVETFKAPPADTNENFAGMTQTARDRFFQKWAEERAKIADVENGIYVLVCAKPPGYAVLVSPELAKRFTPANVTHLKSLLPGRGMTSTYDTRFIEAVKYVEQVLALPPREASSSSTPWMLVWLSVGMLFIVGVLVIIRVVGTRHALHPDAAPAPSPTAATPPRPSGVISVVGGPIGAMPGALPRLPFRTDEDSGRRMADGSGQDGLAETQPLSRPEESGRGDEDRDR